MLEHQLAQVVLPLWALVVRSSEDQQCLGPGTPGVICGCSVLVVRPSYREPGLIFLNHRIK